MAKTDSAPINKGHPSNFEIQSKKVWKSLLYFVNELFQTKYWELQSLWNKDEHWDHFRDRMIVDQTR